MTRRSGTLSKTAPAVLTALMLLVIVGCRQQAASLANTNSAPAAADNATGFDAGRAYEHVKRMVALGPRPSGSEAIKKAQQYIEAELKSYGLKVAQQRFDAQTPRGAIPMMNIIGELPGEKPDVLLIAGHYDSKLQRGFIGANDSGSSTAAVLELARVLSRSKPEYTLWFVFFDGEEAVVDWNANEGTDNTYGSRHMVSKLTADGRVGQIKALVLVDMIGDKNLDLLKDYESTRWLVDIIWGTARQMGYGKHFLNSEGAYSDDHIPFRKAGIPAIDIIDFNFGPDNSYWHTDQDTLDKVSGESMKIVGDVVIKALPEIFKALNASRGGR
jgi:glutaminyl-peptide cyclotransferase